MTRGCIKFNFKLKNMKKILLLFITIYCVPVFSQNTTTCNYVFSPPPMNSSGSLTRPNQLIHAIDLNIENNTTINFNSAEIYVMSMHSQPEQVHQAKIYLYNDQNGTPGNLISSLDVTPTSVSFLGETGSPNSILVSYYKVTIPLPFNSVNSNATGSKVWFGYLLKTPNNQIVYQYMLPKTDTMGLNTFINNSWQSSGFETPLTITKSCTENTLATNNLTIEKLITYPNPTKGDIFFKHKNIKNIEVYDMNGRRLNVKIFSNKIDLSLLSKGIYLLKYMLTDGTVSHEKIIKE